MNKIKQKLTLLFIPLAVLACKDKNEDITDTVNKNGSIETAVHISHIDSARDEMITTHKVWVKNSIYKTIEYRDTLPWLGKEDTEAEDSQGDTKPVSVPKDYEIYITVK